MGNILKSHSTEGLYTTQIKDKTLSSKGTTKPQVLNPSDYRRSEILNEEIPDASKRCVELIDSYYESRKYYPERLDSLTNPLIIKFHNEKDEDVECFCTFIRRTTNDHLISTKKTNDTHELEFDHCSYYHGDYWGGCLPKWVEDSET